MMPMHSLTKVSVAFSFIAMFCAGAAQAATINVVREAVDPHETFYGMHSNTGVEGRNLAGAAIEAQFGASTVADGSSESLTWMADPNSWTHEGVTYESINGFAQGENLNMFYSWDGFEISTTSLLTSLSINLAPASAVFDTTPTLDHDPSGGSTQGSSFGFEFQLYDAFAALPGIIDVTYSGIVALSGAAAAGDLFTTMTIDFTGLEGGGLFGNLNFRSDIDNVAIERDLSPVPLSPSMSFLLFGLFALGMIGYRRKDAQAIGAAVQA